MTMWLWQWQWCCVQTLPISSPNVCRIFVSVCVRLCAFVRTSISHAEGREYYYFDLLHPPTINECLGLSLFRAIRRTRHVIVPPQHRRSDGGRNTISKSLLRNYYFFSYSISFKKSVSTLVHESQQLNYRRCIAQTPWQTHAHLARYSFDILARLYRICSIVHVCIHALCILILYYIQYRLVGCASQSVFAHKMVIFLY